MNIKEIRQINLRHWVAMHGTPPKEKSFFSQLLGGTSSFGERAARRIEATYKMGNMYLDDPEAALKERGKLIDNGMDRRIIEGGRRTIDPTPKSKPQQAEIEIPQYKELGGSMGGGLLLRDQPGEIHGWKVTPDWIEKNVKNHTGSGNLRIVTGFGDSMRPLYNPGDPLLVDSGVREVSFDSIYFFRIGDEGFIKRLQRVPGQGIVAISENKSYRDWVVTPEMDFEVFARVIKVWCGSEF